MNKLFPIVLALLFFSCGDSEAKVEISESSETAQWKEGWSKSNMLDKIQECTITPCDNDYITCSDLRLMCKCDVESYAHTLSYLEWKNFTSMRFPEDSTFPNRYLEILENILLYKKECYFDNNLTSTFILSVLYDFEDVIAEIKQSKGLKDNE